MTTPDPTCPDCHGTGIASKRLYMRGLTDPETREKYDLYTMTVCRCGEPKPDNEEGETS